ncbi:MAG: ABC transporter permease [Pseudobdellovibrio sp.]
MNSVKPIYIVLKKELRSLFLSPLFYFITFLATILMGITYAVSVWNFSQTLANAMLTMLGGSPQQQNIHYVVFVPHLSLLNLIYIFVVPALAMKLISEERKNRTFDLLLTSPINSAQIVISKYLALFLVNLGLALVCLGYIFISAKMFKFDLTPSVLALTGIFLCGCTYAAMNLFASSLTDSALVAFFVGIVFNICIWLLGGMTELVDQPILKALLDQISLNVHLQPLIEGVVKLNGIVFFLSIIFVFCFLTERVIESVRWRA